MSAHRLSGVLLRLRIRRSCSYLVTSRSLCEPVKNVIGSYLVLGFCQVCVDELVLLHLARVSSELTPDCVSSGPISRKDRLRFRG